MFNSRCLLYTSIPAFARGDMPTKMSWDWSTAGKRDAKGKPLVVTNDDAVSYTHLDVYKRQDVEGAQLHGAQYSHIVVNLRRDPHGTVGRHDPGRAGGADADGTCLLYTSRCV